MASDFGKLLKRLREENGMTQQELADQLGVGLRQVQRYEDETIPKIKTLQELGNIFKYDFISHIADTDNNVEEPTIPFHKQRQVQKLKTGPFMVPFVPVKAQAGYVKAMDQELYLDTLEKFQLPPGVNPHGAVWRYWEVEGDSMEPEYRNGDMLLTTQVHPMDWENLRNFYAHVIVTAERVLFKRIYCKNDLEWVLISDNEENYPQQLLTTDYIKEVWVVRRRISKNIPIPKRFEIKI